MTCIIFILIIFSIPNSTSFPLKDLLFKLLKRNSTDRINFEDFSTHEFLMQTKQEFSQVEELSKNFNNELKMLDNMNNNLSSKSGVKKNTFKNIQEQKRMMQKAQEAEPVVRASQAINEKSYKHEEILPIQKKQPVNITREPEKSHSNVKELDDYVLVFNKPQQSTIPSHTIPIPLSNFMILYLLVIVFQMKFQIL